MKKILFVLSLFISAFSFGQNTHIITPGLNLQQQYDGGKAYMHVGSTLPDTDTFYILNTGQSNAGFQPSLTSASDTATNFKVFIFNRATNAWVIASPTVAPFPAPVGSTLGCNIAWYLGKYIQQATGKYVKILNYYHGSTAISGWWTGTTTGPDYDSVTAYVAASGWTHTDLLLWDQGESNTGAWTPYAGGSSNYLQSWDSLLSRWRGTSYISPTTPTIVVGMPRKDMGSTGDFHIMDTVLRMIGSTRDRYTGYAETDSAAVNASDIHFSNPGKKTIALAAYNQYLTLPKRIPLAAGNFAYVVAQHTDSINGSTNYQLTGISDWNTSNYGNAGVGFYSGPTTLPNRGQVMISGLNSNFSGYENGQMVYSALSNIGAIQHQFYIGGIKYASISTGALALFANMTITLNNTSSTQQNIIQYVGNSGNSQWYVGVTGTAFVAAPPSSWIWQAGANGYVANISKTGQFKIGGSGSTAATAQLQFSKGTNAASGAPMKFTLPSAKILATPEKGAMETDSLGYLMFTDSTATRDTVAMRRWVESLINSGTYTVTVATGTNCTAAGATYGMYSKTGNIYHVNIRGTVTPTAAGTCQFTVSLPSGTNANIMSNEGSGMVSDATAGRILADVGASSSTLMVVTFTAVGIISTSYGIQFDYTN